MKNIEKKIYEFAVNNHNDLCNTNVPNTVRLKKGFDFCIIEENDNQYLIIGKDFVVKTECEILIDDESKESGKWKKDYMAVEQTHAYSENRKDIGLKKCFKEIKKYNHG